MQEQSAVKIPILTYHSIDESGSIISTDPKTFKRQMKHLSDTGYQAVCMSKLTNLLTSGGEIEPKTVALTFDDGFQNFYTEAFPVLQQFNFDATVFLVSDYCGKFNDWSGNPPKLGRSRLLDWKEIKEMSRYGIEFGAHTRTHPDLTKMSVSQITEETRGSKSVIEDAVGSEARTFAYPFGRYNSKVKNIAQGIFSSACSTNLGKAAPKSDVYSLERIDTYYLSDQKVFESLPRRSFDHYLMVRQAMRDLKSLIYRN